MPDEAAAAPQSLAVPESANATDSVVEAWFVETFHNVPNLSTELFNRFAAAKERLKELLRSALEG